MGLAMAKKYIEDLNKDEKPELVAFTQMGRPDARKMLKIAAVSPAYSARCVRRLDLCLDGNTSKPCHW